MSTANRNTFLTDKSIRSTLLAAILTSLAPVVASLVDGIFASNLIGQEAFSAICLVLPLVRIITVMILVCHMGANILAARQLGKRDLTTARAYFSVALWSSLAVGILAFIILFADISRISAMLTNSDILLPMVKDYLAIIALNLPVVAISSTLNFFVSGEGYPQRTSRIVLISSLANVLLDYLLMGILGLGVTGAAWGTVASSILNVLLHLPFLIRGKSSYRIVHIGKQKIPLLKNSLVQGFAFNIINITLNLFLMLINGLMERKLGVANFYQWAICLQMQMFMLCICSGSVAGSIYLGNTLLGEDDYEGVRTVVNRLLRMHFVVYFSFVLLMTLLPNIFTFVFGIHDTSLAQAARFPFFCFSFYFMCYCFECAYTNIFQMMGYVKEKIIFIISFSLVVFLFVWLGSMANTTIMWAGFPIGAILVVLASVLFAYSRHCKDRGLTRFTLQPTRPSYVNVDCSFPYDALQIDTALAQLEQFANTSEMPKKRIGEIAIYCKQLLEEIMKESREKSAKYYDFKLIYDDSKEPALRIVLKNAGKPVNPTTSLTSLTPSGMTVDYHYGYSMNITILRCPCS